ncbi:hypothetical protein FACS1894124_5510 [Spirochaetia bacterium]|nr:hypothetical protein FACS1894124_5510 [Spirochaetia bacterium]
MMIPGLTLSLAAQDKLTNVHVWVAPTEGGSEEDREYFDFNLPEEVKGGGYELTNPLYIELAAAKENSDFYITTELTYDEEYQENIITMELYNTKTGELLITNGMSYDTTDMMYDWNLTLIYRLMANAPITKIANFEEFERLMAGEKPKRIFPDYWVFLGLRAGISPRWYRVPAGAPYLESRWTRGNTFEAGLQMGFYPRTFLALQTELLITQENALFRYTTIVDGNLTLPDDRNQNLSLQIPLLLKGIIKLNNRFSIFPLGGAFVTLPLSNYSAALPLGFSAGLGMGVRLGERGNLFFDARYSQDFDFTRRPDGTKAYWRQMLTVSAGYEWGFNKREPKKQKAAEPEKQTAALADTAPDDAASEPW